MLSYLDVLGLLIIGLLSTLTRCHKTVATSTVIRMTGRTIKLLNVAGKKRERRRGGGGGGRTRERDRQTDRELRTQGLRFEAITYSYNQSLLS